jgi:hypothetical protein
LFFPLFRKSLPNGHIAQILCREFTIVSVRQRAAFFAGLRKTVPEHRTIENCVDEHEDTMDGHRSALPLKPPILPAA